MKKIITKYPTASLITLSIICGLLWRIEVEYHGWAGLTWISYFHLAVPFGFGLFLLWANLFLEISWKKRAFINTFAITYGILLYYGLVISLSYNFAGGPFGVLLILQTPEWQLHLIRYLIFPLIPFTPIGAYLILKIFRIKLPVKFLALAIIGIIISIPVSLLILQVTNHKGGHDFIHVIKSGILIPFWVFSIGLLIIGQQRN